VTGGPTESSRTSITSSGRFAQEYTNGMLAQSTDLGEQLLGAVAAPYPWKRARWRDRHSRLLRTISGCDKRDDGVKQHYRSEAQAAVVTHGRPRCRYGREPGSASVAALDGHRGRR